MQGVAALCLATLSPQPTTRLTPMNDVPDLTEPVVIKLPTQIDIANAGEVGSRLMSGFAWGGVVVADMTATRFCDSLGAKVLLKAHSQASHLDCQLRFALPGGQVLRVLHLLGARANTPITTQASGQWRRC